MLPLRFAMVGVPNSVSVVVCVFVSNVQIWGAHGLEEMYVFAKPCFHVGARLLPLHY